MRPALFAPVAAVMLLASCAVVPPASSMQPRVPTPATSQPDMVTCTYRPAGTPARPVDPPKGMGVAATGTVRVTLDLAGSPLRLDLDRRLAPCAVNSFESLAEQGFFDGTECHRLATSGIFILQCGDPTGTGEGGPGYRFDDEVAATATYPAGTVAMANSGPDTNGSQFFVVYADTPLPPSYTIVGTMDADSIQAVADLAYQGHDSAFGDSGHPNAPASITRVTLG